MGGKKPLPADVLGTFPRFQMPVLTDSEGPTMFPFLTWLPGNPEQWFLKFSLYSFMLPVFLVSQCAHSRLLNARAENPTVFVCYDNLPTLAEPSSAASLQPVMAADSMGLPQKGKSRARCHREWQEPAGMHVKPRLWDDESGS